MSPRRRHDPYPWPYDGRRRRRSDRLALVVAGAQRAGRRSATDVASPTSRARRRCARVGGLVVCVRHGARTAGARDRSADAPAVRRRRLAARRPRPRPTTSSSTRRGATASSPGRSTRAPRAWRRPPRCSRASAREVAGRLHAPHAPTTAATSASPLTDAVRAARPDARRARARQRHDVRRHLRCRRHHRPPRACSTPSSRPATAHQEPTR